MITAREATLDRLVVQGSIGSVVIDKRKYKLVAYFSDQMHSSGQKAAKVIGCKTTTVPAGNDFRLTKQALEQAVAKNREQDLIPFFVCGTFGTTNTTAIDDLPGIADVAQKESLWYHVDATYAGSALTCPEFRPLAAGSERADSFNFNPHKWVLTNFDCLALWVADSTHLVNALSIHREYYPKAEGDTAFLPLGRRFRSLKLWFAMRMYGAEGIRKHIRDDVMQAKWLANQLVADGRFELIVPVVFGLVVFRIKPKALSDPSKVSHANTALIKAINDNGRVLLIGTKLNGNEVLRAAVGSTFGTQKNAHLLFVILKEQAAKAIIAPE
ncbi:hypothetical protein FBU59_003397 [Linderina macrospora]|uniref:Uncharacterized protein n=1 Tax=Linderina macrospora TaxID=4868 RepID=A0ACC1J8H0_9FUNG|nr:hypothetical protein FBU59_003397 [Linderina macrospora]